MKIIINKNKIFRTILYITIIFLITYFVIPAIYLIIMYLYYFLSSHLYPNILYSIDFEGYYFYYLYFLSLGLLIYKVLLPYILHQENKLSKDKLYLFIISSLMIVMLGSHIIDDILPKDLSEIHLFFFALVIISLFMSLPLLPLIIYIILLDRKRIHERHPTLSKILSIILIIISILLIITFIVNFFTGRFICC